MYAPEDVVSVKLKEAFTETTEAQSEQEDADIEEADNLTRQEEV